MSNTTRNAALAATAILSGAAATAQFTMNSEGFRTTPYRDVTGKWTVCNGETHGINPNRKYTEMDCAKMFLHSLTQHGSEIYDCLPPDLPVGVRGVFTDLAYNMGSSGFCHSAMAIHAAADDLKGACNAIPAYSYAGKLDCKINYNNCYGVYLRRLAEQKECLKGLQDE